jgi:hypothetical protein
MLRSLRVLLLGGAVSFVSILTLTERAAACSVCLAGDPFLDAQGTTVQQKGNFSAFLQARGWKKKSGLLPGEHGDGHGEEGFEKNSSQRLDLFLSWTPFDRLTVTLDLPWAFNEITEVEGDERTTSTLSGFSDMSLSASAVLWRNRDVLPATWFEGRAFLKFPTGKSSQEVDGRKDPHLQVGTGSWDFGFGLAAVHRLEWASLYSSVFYRVNTEGSLDYEYGDVLLANVAVQVPLGHALKTGFLNPFTAGFELNFRYADFDEFRASRFDDSGGSILYLTPSLRVQLPWPWEGIGPSLRAAVQIPATSSWLHGFQEEDPIWFAGLQYTF